MAHAHESNTKRIWKVFALLSVITTVEVALGIASFTWGGLLGVFFLGNFWARATQRDAIAGISVAIPVMAFVVFSRQLSNWFPALADLLRPFTGIAFPWYVLIGTSITMIVGMSLSVLFPSKPRAV